MKKRNRFFFSCMIFFLAFHSIALYADVKHLADISYLIVDLKYSKKEGVKIYNIQPGTFSPMPGDIYVFGGDGVILPKAADFLTHLQVKKKWMVGNIYPPLKKSLTAQGWRVVSSLDALLKDPAFLKCAALHPADPSAIHSYSGIVYSDSDARSFQKTYPGILFVNAKQYQADGKIYPAKYDALLVAKIQKEMPAEFYLLKPGVQAQASGAIVVASHDLDVVLRRTLNPASKTFRIEKFYKSDYLRVAHPVADKNAKGYGYHYDAAMRVAFILTHDQGKMSYHALGGFWTLPSKALEEKGTLNQKRVSYDAPPFYRAVDPQLLSEVNRQVEKAI